MICFHIFHHSRSTRSLAGCMRIAALLLVVLVSVLAIAPQSGHASPAEAAPLSSYAFTVTTTADTHDAQPGDGVCADSSGQCSLRAATEEADALPAGSSITITVPAGTYALTLGTLQLTCQCTITIHGTGSTTTIITGNHTFGIMSISRKVSAHLSQLTIEGGSANNGNGGGIMNRGRLSVSNSIISNNSANKGGGISNYIGRLSVSNSTISGNSATGGNGNSGGGGGIYNQNGRLSVSTSTISNNSATTGDGGGIANYYGTLSVSTSTISGNSAYFRGGGIWNDANGTLSVSTSTFSNNSAYFGDGGGISTSLGTATVSTSTFSNNSATNGVGGGGISNHGTLTVSTSTFSNNSATDGGGISNTGLGSMLSVSNSAFSGNSAKINGYGSGGGIANAGRLSVSTSTFSNNSADGYGGGIFTSPGMVTVSTSTISGNSASFGGGIDNYQSSTVTLTGTIVANSPTGSNCAGTISEGVGYNLDSGTSCGFSLSTDLTNTDPQLGPLGNNGGSTQTMALLQGSPAIDWVAATSCPPTDQRGQTRPDNGESACDIGAYESSY